MGGAANAAMSSLKAGEVLPVQKKLNIPSVAKLNRAGQVKTQANPLSAGEVMKYFPKSVPAVWTVGDSIKNQYNMIYSSFFTTTNEKMSAKAQSSANDKEVAQYFTLVAFLAMAMSYYTVFKSYHTAVSKQAHLQMLLTNPRARVAHGEDGAELLAKIKEMDSSKALASTDVVSEQLTHVEELIKAKKALNAVKPVETQELSLISAYAPPAPAAPTHYQIDLEQPAYVQAQQPLLMA